jgi:hypothetical protein
VKEKIWELSVPLGELPDRETLWKIATELEALERPYRTRRLLGRPDAHPQGYVSLLVELLEKVRGRDGTLTAQKDGGGAQGAILKRCCGFRAPPTTSILAAMGVHGESSAYLIFYWRSCLEREGQPRDARTHLWAMLNHRRAIWKELKPMQAKLFQQYPVLKEKAPKVLPGTAPAFAGTVKRGNMIFVLSSWGYATDLIVGGVLLYACCINAERLREASEEDLAEELSKKIAPRVLPLETILGLLRGEADVEEVEQALILHRLADF